VDSRPGIRNDQANVLIVRKYIWRGWRQETREVIERRLLPVSGHFATEEETSHGILQNEIRQLDIYPISLITLLYHQAWLLPCLTS
jgi:hypothetical protein